MGFFDDIGSTIGNIGNILKPIAGVLPISGGLAGRAGGLPGIIGGIGGGQYASDQIQGGGPGVPPPPAEDPRIAEITKAKQQQAKEFRAGIPGLEAGMTRQYKLQAHNDLAGQLAQIRRDAAKRGIMNSGIRLGNEAGAQGAEASNIAKMKNMLHTNIASQADQLDQDAINSAVTQTQIQQQLQDNIYNQALKQLQEKNSALSGIGTAVGGLVGTIAGKNST